MGRIPFDPATNYYQLLGVGASASPEEIQAAYRRLAKENHPDLNAGSEAAAARMAQLNVAKSVLLDNATRAHYDELRGLRVPRDEVVRAAGARRGYVTVRYAPSAYDVPTRPRYRVVSSAAARSMPRAGLDRGTGILLLIAVPLIVILVVYVFQAMQLSIQPLKAIPFDTTLSPGANNKPTAHGVADGVFMMVHGQPISRELATRANNFILARYDSSPEGELLRADGRRLVRSAGAGDEAGWDEAVGDICHLAERC